jgi:ABC-2 type transport system permease protein
MRVAIAVALKELRQRFRDRSAIFMAFVAPTLLAAIVTGAFGSGFGPNTSGIRIDVAFADEDHSQVSKAFASALRSKDLRTLVNLKPVASASAARRVVDDGVGAAFVIPKGFQSSVSNGGQARIDVLRRADQPVAGDIAEAIATGFTQRVGATRLSVFTAVRARGGNPAEIGALTQKAVRDAVLVDVRDAGLAKRPVSGANYFGPGMAMFFLFFTVGFGARSLFAEREQGTLQRIFAAPAGRSAVVAGKAMAVFVLGLCSMSSVYVTMRVLFGVDWGDPLAVAALTFLTVLALMGVSAVVQTFAKTEQQAAAYGSIVGMVFALAGGNFFPLFQMPAMIQKVSALTPNGWALRGFTDIAYDGARAADLLPNYLAIGAIAAVCSVIAFVNAKRIAVR